ncbi:MAG TPA: NAD(P)-dependent oxidoreductase [Vicinamibacterales bacterium]|nr:NAD(P)-dependent oxidoreductase [Vicinamibacterales bacterium]
MKIGFIGLGRMGQGMSMRLLGGGHDLIVYNRSAGKTADLEKAGAKAASTIAAVCKDREIVISMVADDAALNDVALGAGGVRDGLANGAIHVAMGTHSAAAIQAVAAAHGEKGQAFVAAPVLGRPDAAAAGQIVIVCAGPLAALRKCDAAFSVMGRKTMEAASAPEAAIAIKLANNFVLGCAVETMAEAFALVRKYGVNPQVFYDVMTEGLFAAPAYKVYGKLIVDSSYDKPGFTVKLGLKDIKLALAAAELVGVPLPSGSVVRDRLIGAIAHGDGDKDWAVLGREQGRASGLD